MGADDCNVTTVDTIENAQAINSTEQTLMEKYILMFQYVIFATGLFGNMFSFILFSRKNIRLYDNIILFKAFAVSDTISLAME